MQCVDRELFVLLRARRLLNMRDGLFLGRHEQRVSCAVHLHIEHPHRHSIHHRLHDRDGLCECREDNANLDHRLHGVYV